MFSWDIRNPICDSCTARSLKPMEGHTAQLDIRNPICDQGHTSLCFHGTSEIRSVILALQGHTSLWRVILHNGTSEIRSMILALQGHSSKPMEGHTVQLDIRNPICDQGHTSLWMVSYCKMGDPKPVCNSYTARSHKPMEGHTGFLQSHMRLRGVILYNTMGHICDSCCARSHKPMEGHTAQWDIRNSICDSCTARSLKQAY